MAREIYTNPVTFVIYRIAGVVPTVPSPPTLRKYNAGFLDTDLEIGEFGRNIVDGKLFYRSTTGIEEYEDILFGKESTAGSLVTENFSIVEEAGELVIKYGSTVIMKINSSGYLKVLDDIEPFASM